MKLTIIETDESCPDKPKQITTYCEKVIGKTLFRVVGLHNDKIDLTKALEDIIINKILLQENLTTNCKK